MLRLAWCVALTLFAWTAMPAGADETAPSLATLSADAQPWTGDLDGMAQRRVIRVLVPYSKTFYFIDLGGTQRGISYELMRAFEEDLNKKMKTGNLRIDLHFIPTARDQLIPALLDGRGDVVAANLTITPERQKQVDFTTPLAEHIKELAVTGPGGPELKSVDDLAGRSVFVRKATSYFESLTALNAKFKERGLPEMEIHEAPGHFEAEDVLEMANAGLAPLVFADRYLANFWKQVFPNITVHEDVAIREEGEIAFAIRKDSPQFMAALNPFLEKHRAGTAFGNVVLKRYLKSVKWVKNASADAERAKLQKLIDTFRKYGEQYNVDYILMAAQGYQESRLDQSVKSRVGAVGIMQVMPDTGKELAVGDIKQVEPNIHAGVKYVRFMIDHYYADEPMDEENKVLFAFAAYNAGPGRVRSLRREAEARELDPNQWFNNVEYVAADRIGRETVQYVRNIYKYYVAYKLLGQQLALRKTSAAQ
ncbi:MAG: lytic transglycosylase F [Proteobacteria bacterium]|nr:lytic transglycosylase F [Pseudomonadota bacterium]